jgi:uncharacterized protein (TIGR03083 family)
LLTILGSAATMVGMDLNALVDHLDQQGALLAAAAERAGLDATVPTCPGWDVRALLAHVGMVHRWAAGIVRDEPGASRRSDFPAPETGLLDWFVAGHAGLVAALRAAPSDLAAWSFLPAPSPLEFWARRQAHETAIHRADAEAAAGWSAEYEPEVAADGLGELLEGFYGRKGGRLVADPGFTLRVMPLDANVSWFVQVGPDSRSVTRDGSADADCTLTGSAEDLYLDLWNRYPSGSVSLSGDARPLHLWRDLAQVSWD